MASKRIPSQDEERRSEDWRLIELMEEDDV